DILKSKNNGACRVTTEIWLFSIESSRRPPNHHRSHRESPEHRRRPCNLTGEEISPCFDHFSSFSTIFLLDPATGEGFGWKPTLFLVDLVSKDP
ncbi:BnaC09g51210D, partial [Brassica napus]